MSGIFIKTFNILHLQKQKFACYNGHLKVGTAQNMCVARFTIRIDLYVAI